LVPNTAVDVSRLAWLLDDLAKRVAQVEHAIVLSVDGLLMASSGGMSRDDAEHLAAVSSGVQSLARGAGKRFNGGPVLQTIIEMQSAFLFVTAAGDGACLAVLASQDADVGVVAYEMTMLVTRANDVLTSAARTDPSTAGE
jgi:predicted regulator of Ras-like GTPase activity (Roadblock/LC7/MglB family)